MEVEADIICGTDDRMFILVNPGNYNGKYEGVLAINSIDDDIIGNNVEKDRMKEYFMGKYGKGLTFICTYIF